MPTTILQNLFFSRTRRRAAYLYIKRRKRGWSKLQSPAPLLGPERGLHKYARAVTKRKTLGPDHLTLITLHLFYQPSRVQGCKALSPREPPQ